MTRADWATSSQPNLWTFIFGVDTGVRQTDIHIHYLVDIEFRIDGRCVAMKLAHTCPDVEVLVR
jgi:hypothetical protein